MFLAPSDPTVVSPMERCFSGQAVTTRLFSPALEPCSINGYDETHDPSLKPQLLISFFQRHCSVSPCLDNGGLSKPQFDQLWGKCGETVHCTSLRRGNVKHVKSFAWVVSAYISVAFPALHCVSRRLAAHFKSRCERFRRGESSAAVQNLMPRVVIFDLISLLALLILLGEVRATPLVNLFNSAAFLKVCSGQISRTCYKGLTESTAQPTHFFQWFLALADLFTKASYMPASRLCLI